MRRVVFNQKGGVGKSSIAANLAAISAQRGYHTLLVDLDPQCNASQYLLGLGEGGYSADVGDYFMRCISFRKGRPIDQCVSPSRYDNLDVIAANPELGDLESKLESKHKIYKLRDALESLRYYDAVYIDTPPAFNFFTLSALIAARSCLIPFDCDEFSRQALYTLLGNVEEVQSDHNGRLQVEGIVVNQLQPRASLPQKVVQELKDEGLPLLDSTLPSSVKMKESHNSATPLIHMAPKHKLTQQFEALFDELQAF